MAISFTALGRETAKQLQNLNDERTIATLGKELTSKIYEDRHTPEERSNALKSLSKAIREQFPNCPTKPKNQCYRETGKGTNKWRHCIFDHVTLNQEDYDALNPDRKAWREQQQTTPQTQTTEKITLAQIMDTSQLNLSTESQALVQEVLTKVNISLSEFLEKAIVNQAKTMLRKAEADSQDLAAIATYDLLNDKKYQTNPGRAQELTKRAVRAIKKHNASVTETVDRWHITQSAITKLTGSRPSAVAKALEQFKDDIEEMTAIGLNDYTNRKPKTLEGEPREIEKEIDLVALVPDGFTD